jgi:hypothetical protein
MKRFWYGAACAVIFSLSMGMGEVHAQPTPGIGPVNSPPVFSPYLNLLWSGGSPALNYYGLVRPQVQTSVALQGLSSDVSQNQQALNQFGMLPTTGHPTQFLNYGGYFLSNGGTGGGGMSSFAGSAMGSPGGGLRVGAGIGAGAPGGGVAPVGAGLVAPPR